jgi:hypothetical protein
MFYCTPFRLQRPSKTMATPCWLVLIIVSFYAIPEGLLLLSIPCIWILEDVKDVVTYLAHLIARKISPFVTARNISQTRKSQTRI